MISEVKNKGIIQQPIGVQFGNQIADLIVDDSDAIVIPSMRVSEEFCLRIERSQLDGV